ncbi:TPA: hypothetical protein DIV48_00780 [Candidatus Kaiserbacteria bacterium]|nr:hypothetical protein [Candidatus Kaiserbacteria bacterium]
MTKKNTMTTKTDHELAELVATTRASLRAERFAAAGARAKDPNALRKLRKTVARALTERQKRTSAAASAHSDASVSSTSPGSRPTTA